MRAPSVTGVGLALALGCSQSATGADDGQTPEADPIATGPACAEGSKDPVLHFHGRTCPWELVAVGSEVRLRSLALDPEPAFAGRLPRSEERRVGKECRDRGWCYR